MASEWWINKGFDFLDGMPRYRRVDANIQMMSEALHAEPGPITLEVMRQVFARIKPQLATNSDYAEAYKVFIGRHPEYMVDANLSILDSTLVKLGEAVTAENLEDLLQPGNPHSVLDKLVITAAAAQAQAGEAERQSIISNLVGGLKPVIDERGRKVLTNRAGYRVLYKDELERIKALPLEELRQLRDEKAEKKRLQGMSPSELRQDMRKNAAPVSQFEPLSGDTVYYPKHDGDNRVRNLEPILAGDPIQLTAVTIKRLHRDDLHDVVRRFGADAVNAVLAKGRN